MEAKGCYSAQSTAPNSLDLLMAHVGVQSPGEIVCLHRVNTREDFDVISGFPRSHRDIIEGDLHLREGEAIMAHGPDDFHNLELREWLLKLPSDSVAMLDFKVPDILSQVLQVLEETERPYFPPIFHAEVIQGPGGSPPIFNPQEFITARQSVPSSVLALGWTTSLRGEGYSVNMVEAMINVASQFDHLGIIFPLRAVFLPRSEAALELLCEFRNSWFCVWNDNEPISTELHEWLQKHLDPSRTFSELTDINSGLPLPLFT